MIIIIIITISCACTLRFISFSFPFLCLPFRVLFSDISIFFLFYFLSPCISLGPARFLPLYCGVSFLILFSFHSLLITSLLFPFCIYIFYRFPLHVLLYVSPFVFNSPPYILFHFTFLSALSFVPSPLPSYFSYFPIFTSLLQYSVFSYSLILFVISPNFLTSFTFILSFLVSFL